MNFVFEYYFSVIICQHNGTRVHVSHWINISNYASLSFFFHFDNSCFVNFFICSIFSSSFSSFLFFQFTFYRWTEKSCLSRRTEFQPKIGERFECWWFYFPFIQTQTQSSFIVIPRKYWTVSYWNGNAVSFFFFSQNQPLLTTALPFPCIHRYTSINTEHIPSAIPHNEYEFPFRYNTQT